MDVSADLARILAAKSFSETDLAEVRAKAVDARSVAANDESTLRVVTGHVLLWTESGPEMRRHMVAIDGRAFNVGYDLYEQLRPRAPYHVYFAGSSFVAIEPAPASAVPDCVTEAARAAGLSRDDPRARTDPRVTDRLRHELTTAYQRILDFTPEDLGQHRLGKLTPAAKKKLQSNRTGLFVAGIFVLFLSVSFVVVSPRPSMLLYVGAGLGALLGIWFIKKGIEYTLSISRGRVAGALAVVDLDVVGRERSATVFLRTETGHAVGVDRRAFVVHGFHPDVLDALTYRVFLSPGASLSVLSLEPGPDLSPLFRDVAPRSD